MADATLQRTISDYLRIALIILISTTSGTTYAFFKVGGVDLRVGDVDINGLVNDPAKISSATEAGAAALARTMRSLATLQGETDRDIRAYLERLSSLIGELESAVDDQVQSAVDRVVLELNTLTNDVDSAVRGWITEAECAVSVSLDEILRRASVNIPIFTSSKVRYTLPFLKPKKRLIRRGVRYVPDVVEIDRTQITPSTSEYRKIRDAFVANLSYARASDPAIKVVETYAELANLAKWAQCEHRTGEFAIFLTRDFVKWNNFIRPWTTAVRLKS